MRRPAALVALVLTGSPAVPAGAVSETAAGFAAAMQGCWNRVGDAAAEPGRTDARQICLTGGVEGVLEVVDCRGINDLVECAPREGSYAFREEKFWSDIGAVPAEDALHHCDVLLEAGNRFTLANCAWVEAPAGAAPIGDMVYERVVGQ